MTANKMQITKRTVTAVVIAVMATYCSINLPKPRLNSLELRLPKMYINKTLSIPEQCHVVHTETIQRHGSRHLNNVEKIEKIVTFFKELDQRGLWKNSTLIEWANDLMENERHNTGNICVTGEIEIAGIAQRLRERLHLDDDMNGDIEVINTFKKRTQQTRDIFLKNLLPEKYPKSQLHIEDANKCEEIIGSDGSVNRTVFDNYSPLRFFSICPKYSSYKQDPSLKKDLGNSFSYNPHISLIEGDNMIWNEILVDVSKINTDEKVKIIKNMYLMCQFEASCYGDYNRTCNLLLKEPDILKELNYNDDMKLHFIKGQRNPLNYKMACPLARSMMKGVADNFIANSNDAEVKKNFISKFDKYFDFSNITANRANLRFGHAESIMKYPHVDNESSHFTGNKFVPMSANMQIDLVNCDGKFYLRFLSNEIPMILDIVNDEMSKYNDDLKKYRLYDIQPWFDQWIDILKGNDMENCLYDDFVSICGEPNCNS